MKQAMDTIVSKNMTNRDTQDIVMGKILDIEELSRDNHILVMKSLETVAELITLMNKRINELEAKVNG